MTYELKDILRKLNHVSAEEHHRIHHEICDYISGQQLPDSMMLDDYLTSIKYYEPTLCLFKTRVKICVCGYS